MTTVINLYAGPGAGKSTTAAKIFALLKDRGQNAEIVTEYVKQWAWDEKKPVDYDQFYLFAKQAKAEYRLHGKVDYIVTDAPVLLTSYYAQVYGTPEQAVVFRSMLLTYLRMCADKGQTYLHFYLGRTKKYDPRGRFQNEAQARNIDEELRRYVLEMGIKPFEIPADAQCAESIVNMVLDKPEEKSKGSLWTTPALTPGSPEYEELSEKLKLDPSVTAEHIQHAVETAKKREATLGVSKTEGLR